MYSWYQHVAWDRHYMIIIEPCHEKGQILWHIRRAKAEIRLCICAIWSGHVLSAHRITLCYEINTTPIRKECDQTAGTYMLTWDFAVLVGRKIPFSHGPAKLKYYGNTDVNTITSCNKRKNMCRETKFPTILYVRPVKTQISLRECAGWSESLLSTWRRFAS